MSRPERIGPRASRGHPQTPHVGTGSGAPLSLIRADAHQSTLPHVLWDQRLLGLSWSGAETVEWMH